MRERVDQVRLRGDVLFLEHAEPADEEPVRDDVALRKDFVRVERAGPARGRVRRGD